MKINLKKSYLKKKKRYLTNIFGTLEKPRLAVFKSKKHIYAQVINDIIGHTFVFSSTLDRNLNGKIISSSIKKASFLVGKQIGEKLKKKEINSIIFDRAKRLYSGRVKALAEGARQKGLIF
jgi:large subunit ribosomal protein L18